MTTLVVGATGATGRLLVAQLLERGKRVKAIVRSAERLPDAVRNHPNLVVIEANILDLDDMEIARHVEDCNEVASCLGHTMSFGGVFGPPRRLVAEATRRLCNAIKANASPTSTRFVLMNTVGNRNRDVREPVSLAQMCVIGLVRLLVPPHADNEQAADYLRTGIGQNDSAIEWAVVRPDSLRDEEAVSEYEVHPSPTRSAIFDPGRTSRINVAHFMARLITDDEPWNEWKGRMPVVYNAESSTAEQAVPGQRDSANRAA